MSHHLKNFATCDPENLSVKDKGQNLVGGEWCDSRETVEVVDPLTGKPMITIPNTQLDEIQPFIDGMKSCPKYGRHNPFLNKERYLMLGEVNRKLCEVMHDPEVFKFIWRLNQRQIPKSDQQSQSEISVTTDFFENFCGDQVRFLARGFTNPGDHLGQFSQGFRWPFGPVGVISPFNFPIEIPVLQFMGALYMGNRPTVKPDMRCSMVLEQYVRMLHYCGLPKEDMDLIHCDGPVMEKILR
jgi:1-pyrroline-5-carboxylate dehydrogenase